MDAKLLMIQVNGFIANDVESIVSQDVSDRSGWESPEAAVQNWRQRGVYNTGRYQPFENGRQLVTDVSGDRQYAELGITSTFERVYFVLVPDGPVSTEHPAADLELV
ncbi:hypothetical protein C5D98_14885 [Rathayibacter rathayi]|uniref:hypothetical protein n=1 Tax=Rathayibacter rathayi TaxID=33887 RepID=UPI000CE7D709|nr:hypothetical protein [Rathayibacter rathayi]PPG77467.1 hypothetical protein C5C15_09230 [Rathayibacter rathayi]PPI65235.1 hypothetical protein C5D98_14885 [Rathayibacter rathayi]